MSCLGWEYIFVSPSFTYHLRKVSGGRFVVLQTFLQTSNKSIIINFGYMVQLRSSIDYKKVRKKWFFGEPKTFRSSFRCFFKFSFFLFSVSVRWIVFQTSHSLNVEKQRGVMRAHQNEALGWNWPTIVPKDSGKKR